LLLYKQSKKFSEQIIISELYLDNHAYDLFNTIIEVDGFNSNPKQWLSYTLQKNPIKFGECQLILDFHETLEKDKDKYYLLIDRKPRILLNHTVLTSEVLLKYSCLITSCLSFFQGNDIDYKIAILNSIETSTVQHRPKEDKVKVLNKNLGRFLINQPILEFLSKVNHSLVNNSDFVDQTIKLFNQALSSDGTTEFMLYYTVLEKLRNELQGNKPNKEKFRFTIGKRINDFIRAKLQKIKAYVIDKEKEVFESAKDDKLVNIKYLPQKDQFTEFFEIMKINPTNFDLEWKGKVSLRGAIFHGKYIESDDPLLIDTNSKMQLFCANTLYNYLIGTNETN